MAVTADNTVIPATKHLDNEGMKVDYEVAASTVIFRNSFVGLNATGYLTSYVAPAIYTGVTATGTKFVGLAPDAIASQTSDGDARCRVLIDGYFQYTLSSTDRVDIGTPVFASDNSTLVMAGSSGNHVGYIVGFPGSNLALVKLVGPIAQWAGHLLTVVSPDIEMKTLGNKMLLVHETQNPNGLLCANLVCLTTEAHVAASAQGVLTIQHTADTTMGITATVVDNDPVDDITVPAALGVLWNPASATGQAMIAAPAGKQINAEVTTASNEGANDAGKFKVIAQFMAL